MLVACGLLSVVAHAKEASMTLVFSGYVYNDTCTLSHQKATNAQTPTINGCQDTPKQILISVLTPNQSHQYEPYSPSKQLISRETTAKGTKLRYQIVYQ